MPWFYRCDVQYLDPNDLLNKQFSVTVASINRLPQSLAANAVRQKAYGLIKQFKLSPPDPNATQDSLDLDVTFCEERFG
jgi:hypothetical protein